jgi:DNA-binding MarR family transcriptional regulator
MLMDDRLIFLLFKAQNKLKNYIRSQLAASGVRISVVQAGILFLLKQRDGRTMTELSQILSTDNSAITGLVDRLERSGFISRKMMPNDRRACLICITPDGLEEIDKAKGVIRRVNEEIKEGLSGGEIESFKKVLNGIFEKFGKSAQEQRISDGFHKSGSGKP